MPLGPRPAVSMDVPPYGLSGTLYGALLNHQSALQALGEAINHPPYQRAPQAPVLYLKPRNTLAACGEPVTVPPGVAELEIGATLGLVIGRSACRLSEERALEHLAGYLIVNDVSIPHQPYYRPSIRFKARDGFCPLGPRVVPRAREPLRGQRGMKLARVACAGAIHAAQPQQLSDGRAGVRLTDGRTLAEDEVVWLPPLEVGTILALGLNYAARAKELAFGKEV